MKILILLLLSLTGCAAGHVGMSKSELIDSLGNPSEQSTNANGERYGYRKCRNVGMLLPNRMIIMREKCRVTVYNIEKDVVTRISTRNE